jgi:hypothetical protein
VRLAILALGALAGCDLAQQPTDPTVPDLSCEAITTMRSSMPSRAIDLVFVVSDAPSMLVYRERLHENLARFAPVLETLEGGLPSVQVAFIDASGGYSTERLAACGVRDVPWLKNVQAPWFQCAEDAGVSCRDRNYDDDLGGAMACAGSLPADGPPGPALFDRGLRALAADPGFLRDDAYLALVFISADDDASPGDVADYADAIRAAKPDDALVIISTIAPYDAARLIELGDAFPNRSARTTIDRDDWTDALIIWSGWGEPIGNPCVEGPLDDIDPAMPGLQARCWATEELDGLGPEIPRCTMATSDRPAPDTPLPCYWLAEVDPAEYGCATIATVERAQHHAASLPYLRCGCDATD